MINTRDMTERRQMEDRIREAEKMESLSRMAGGVCHDFNNLLTVIGGNVSLLLMDLQHDDPLYNLATNIETAASTAAKSTRQLLAFTSSLDLRPRNVNLHEIILSNLQTLRQLCGAHITLATSLTQSLGQIRVDASELEQVISGLVLHASGTMSQGGEIVIETRNADLDQAYAKAHPELIRTGYVMLSISDNGPGMDAGVVSRLFEPFSITIERGAGLRLSAIYGIIKQSGGHICVDSVVGHGTTYKIYFPCVDEVIQAVSRDVSPCASEQGSETILLMEDEPAVRQVIRRCLSLRGYTVLEASTDYEASDAIEKCEGTVHLLLIDVDRPGMDGQVLAAQLRNRHPGLRVLFISSYSVDTWGTSELAIPANRLLTKPFTLEMLTSKVRSLLDGPGIQ